MMPLFWFMLWSMLPPLARFSGPDHCAIRESLPNKSSLLKSLKCYNDYMSYVHCEWREHRNTPLQLWFKKDNDRKQCVPYGPAVPDASEQRIAQCRYTTRALAFGIEHIVFFLQNETPSQCLSVPHKPLDLSQHLRARPPDSLSTHDTGDGGQQLSWSSPYPPSSSLSRNITYQLSYRANRQDTWTTEDVKNTSVKLEKRLLLPGCRYEARVRARAGVGQWSHWSPVVSWHTKEDDGQFPSLHCVLEEEKKVTCSWKVSRELAHIITYQLVCGDNDTANFSGCCVNPTVTSDPNGTVLKYSCPLIVEDPAHLLLKLLPTHTIKKFKARQHIRPNPPGQVKVRDKGNNWIVEWMDSNNTPVLRLYYQLCYYKTQDQQGCPIQNISGSMSMNILAASLEPAQLYEVKVRSVVVPGEDAYGGIPSEWTKPVNWTSHEATRSPTTLIYISIGVFVAAAFLTLYCTIPACQRRVVLWVDSVPSPGKSKILSEIKFATSRTLMQSENTSMCKVQHSDSLSTCSSDISLWPTKDSEKKCLDQNIGYWKCDNPPSPSEEVNTTDTSSMSFSGPYIFCQTSGPSHISVDSECEEKEKETPSVDSASPSPVNFTLFSEGYVTLPNRSVSRSTQDLVSHSDANINTHRHDIAEQDQQHPDTSRLPDKTDIQPGLVEPISSHQPPAYTKEPFTPWPQGVTIQASGYCHLPAALVRTEN